VETKDVNRIGQRGGAVRRVDRWVLPRRTELGTSWSDVLALVAPQARAAPLTDRLTD
jgi:hypothetical protein